MGFTDSNLCSSHITIEPVRVATVGQTMGALSAYEAIQIRTSPTREDFFKPQGVSRDQRLER